MSNIIKNFHTHTSRCKHAFGVPHDYAEVAKKSGICAGLGFSDHVPFPDKTWQGCRMECEEIFDYCKDVLALKEKYDFPIYLGFECEWHPRFKNWYKDFLRDELKVDYLVLGSHWFIDEKDAYYFFDFDDKMIAKYRDQTIEAILSGAFDFIAHPDIFMLAYDCWDERVKDCLLPILDAAISMGMPLEINGNGLSRPFLQTSKGLRPPYPVREFWEEAASRGAKIICNSDAHAPEQVIDYAVNARKFAESLGINEFYKGFSFER